jgi:hypothetical protein
MIGCFASGDTLKRFVQYQIENDYFPVKWGFLFSLQAATASLRSSEGMVFALKDAAYLRPSSIDFPTP